MTTAPAKVITGSTSDYVDITDAQVLNTIHLLYIGKRVCVTFIDDRYLPIAAGSIGIVRGVDDGGALEVDFDIGYSNITTRLLPGVDVFEVVDKIAEKK